VAKAYYHPPTAAPAIAPVFPMMYPMPLPMGMDMRAFGYLSHQGFIDPTMMMPLNGMMIPQMIPPSEYNNNSNKSLVNNKPLVGENVSSPLDSAVVSEEGGYLLL
jgi:hypothetical protein